MTSSDRPRGVFFDLGGTLFSYRNVPRTTMPLLLEVAERVGVETDVQQIREQYGQATSEVTERYAERDYYLHQDFFDDVLVRYCALLGSQCDQALRDWYLAAHREAIVHCLDLKDDCRSTLVKLREAQLYLSVVSNIDNDMLHPLIERENLGEFFDHWTSSESAGSCKPHAGFFEHALALSGLRADEVLFVGDSPEHDINGAHAVGMRTALVGDGGLPPPLQSGRASVTPDYVLGSLSELCDILSG